MPRITASSRLLSTHKLVKFGSNGRCIHSRPPYVPPLPRGMSRLPTVLSSKDGKVNITLLETQHVQPFPVDKSSPPFTAPAGWLQNINDVISTNMAKQDTDEERVPPLAFVRCSRGGKTRALKEIAAALKQSIPQSCILYVTFSGYSEVYLSKEQDPTEALCRRIAFAASAENGDMDAFKKFRKLQVTEDQISNWLGDTPKFLSIPNRYFVFSSHVISAVDTLSDCMERFGNRNILCPPLPLIPSINVAADNFDWPELNPRQAIFYGLIPALIYLFRPKFRDAPYSKLVDAIASLDDRGYITDTNVITLLKTFIRGQYSGIPRELLPFMDFWHEDGAGAPTVKWIPMHMIKTFRVFSKLQTISDEMAYFLAEISGLFDRFMDAKVSNRDSWASLFVMTILIRSVSREFGTPLFPVPSSRKRYSVSYQSLFPNYQTTQNAHDLISSMRDPETFPHVAICWPRHAKFAKYDVLVAVYDEWKKRSIYGYQLTGGRKRPDAAPEDELVTKNFCIRGQPASAPSMYNGWHIADEEEINDFLGHSGHCWTPKVWRSLISTSSSTPVLQE